MNTTAILIGLGMIGVALPFVMSPFRKKRAENANKSTAPVQYEEGRVATLSALRDLDFDHKIGKVIDEDYVPVRAQLLAEAAQYIQQEGKEQEDQLEALIQARRASKDASCEGCGASMQADQRFCTNCGAPANRVACPSCGKKVRAGDLFCSSCGGRLEACTEPRRSVRIEAAGKP